jgi:protein-S-isoprenylcysteine O-methyltransferase Ste14
LTFDRVRRQRFHSLNGIMKHILGEIGYIVLFGLLLFVPAGTLNWTRAWVLLVALIGVRAVGTVRLLRTNRDLMDDRSKLPLRRGQPLADKVLLLAFMASFAGLVAFDAFERFHVTVFDEPGIVVASGGLVAFLLGWWVAFAAVWTNAFATTTVRYQPEREHRVVDAGVYGWVRHPMYAGMIAVMVGMGLWLGSYAGAMLAAVPGGILAARIRVEERVLRASVAGYTTYAARVRSRLIPGVW